MNTEKIGAKHIKITVCNGLLTANAFQKALVKSCAIVTDEADSLLPEADLLKNNGATREITLVLISSNQLGLPQGGTLAENLEAGLRWGFELCTDDIGPELCRQVKESSRMMIAIGMPAITNSDIKKKIFAVLFLPHGSRWLKTLPGNDTFIFPPDTVWAFKIPE